MQPGNKSGQNCEREKLIPTWEQSARASTPERGGVSSGHFPLPSPGSGNTKPDQCHSRDWGIQTAQHPGLSAHPALTRAALGPRNAPLTAAATQPGLGLPPAGLPAALLHLHPGHAPPHGLCARVCVPPLRSMTRPRRRLGREKPNPGLGEKRRARSSRRATELPLRPPRVPCASRRAPGPLGAAFPPGLCPASHSTRGLPSGRQAERLKLLVERGGAASPDNPSRSAARKSSQNPGEA